MKFLHLSDLHLGKLVHDFSMLELQEHILGQILKIADREQPACALIAGDVFDRSVASTEALKALDDFLVGLCERGIKTFLIAGNHDSAERLAFASRLIAPSGIHIAAACDGAPEKHVLRDEFGDIHLHLLPFIRPQAVRPFFPGHKLETWTDAVGAVLARAEVDPSARNILVAHQFVTGGVTSESEEFSVGGADNVDACVFEPFDYVALGHLHGPQRVGRDSLRYCGSPLKYSFSEAGHQKSVTVVELGQKGELAVRALPLKPLRDLKTLRGPYLEMASKAFYDTVNREDFLQITLTDEEDQPDALQKLRVIYPYLMHLRYDNLRTRLGGADFTPGDAQALRPMDLFKSLYLEQNGQPLNAEQEAYLSQTIDALWEDAR